MHLTLTQEQFQALVGLLDVAVKQVGLRALEPDVVGLFGALKAAIPAETDAPEGA